MNSRLLKLAGILVLAASGVAASHIPWGKEDAFHGTGFPVFTVAWDRSKDTALFLDYPNPLGYILNPLLFVVVGFFIFCATRWCFHLLNK
ncbi:hypothetical protein [Verrucomicrobium sp. BvORR034]|uniref:hypothetical protein n=1 Tax=Verrucomicrobium sp. BvORR034 TaxID=1396418 RepID=UPI000678EA5B|nr:hypothetical protein [Verrucomicrobium sp. BvORR034]